MKETFKDNVKIYRKQCNMSQTELAEKVGVTQQCVSEWERGNIEPTLTFLWRIADQFQVSIDELVGRYY